MSNVGQQGIEGAQRNQGVSAQEMNIHIARLIANVVKSTLGPKGMDKMLVDSMGDVTVTNDGVTILREMLIENPIGKMMVEIAKTQEREVGDGTTTTVVITGELLTKAQELLRKKVHPTVIAKGYKMAANKAIQVLNEMAVDISVKDKDVLIEIARTAMTGKGSEDNRDLLAEIVVNSIMQVEKDGNINLEDIKVEKKTGATLDDTSIIEGVVLDRAKAHPNMPTSIEDAKIALLDEGLEIKNLDMDAKINLSNPADMQAFMNAEAGIIKGMIDKIQASGANVVICGRNIDDASTHFLSKMGVYAIKRVNRDDMERISKSTGARIVTKISDLSGQDIGDAGIVEEVFMAGTNLTFIKGCPKAKSVTILVRGSTEQMTAEIKRAIEDALGDVSTAVKNKKAVGGAGAPEIILAKELRKYAETLKGREQLAVQAFANSMEIIPETLAENAGLDPIDVLAELRASSEKWPGINVFDGNVMNSWKEGVIEPLKVKTQAVNSAAEVATMILRIDDVMQILNNPNAPPGTGQ